MEQTLQQQAREWLEHRDQLAENRNNLFKTSGMMVSFRASATHVESLSEPLQTEVRRQLNLNTK